MTGLNVKPQAMTKLKEGNYTLRSTFPNRVFFGQLVCVSVWWTLGISHVPTYFVMIHCKQFVRSGQQMQIINIIMNMANKCDSPDHLLSHGQAVPKKCDQFM